MDNKKYTQLVKDKSFPTDNLVPLDAPFVDVRGSIQNLITNGIESVTVITSKKGSVRSNHYHLHGSHYLYLISGSLNYYERDLDGLNIKGPILYKAGEMVFTGPKVIHKTEFLEDAVMLSLATLPNDHNNHEEDLVRMEF